MLDLYSVVTRCSDVRAVECERDSPTSKEFYNVLALHVFLPFAIDEQSQAWLN